MVRTNPGIIRYLLELGVGLDKNPDGSLKYTKEGTHSRPRICFYEDITGGAIATVPQEQTAALPDVDTVEYTAVMDALTTNGAYVGILARTGDGSAPSIHARGTVMATGGIEGLYQHSTNSPYLTGNALTAARRHGVKLEHLDYIRIYPVSLYAEKPSRSFLISELARGEGAVFLNDKGECSVDELLLGDTASQATEAGIEGERSRHVWPSFAPMPRETVREHLPHIYETCFEEGYDTMREPIPVVPTQHYFMGGVRVDLDSRTTMEYLYAVGETSCNGVHGKNRLVGNGLLESLVFAEKAAKRIENSQKGRINYGSDYHAACC